MSHPGAFELKVRALQGDSPLKRCIPRAQAALGVVRGCYRRGTKARTCAAGRGTGWGPGGGRTRGGGSTGARRMRVRFGGFAVLGPAELTACAARR
jgi:hypothetical protein